MKSPEQRIADVRKPSSLANWARLNKRSRVETKFAITRFVLNKPQMSLAPIYKLIADYVTMGINIQTLRKGLTNLSDERVAKLGHEIANVLIPWLDKNNIKGIRAFHNMHVPFPIGRGIVIPVMPTFVFNRNGSLTLVFIIGWTAPGLSDFQKSLFATIVKNSILSQEGFEGSDALVIFVPRLPGTKTERYVREMWINKVRTLSNAELQSQFDRFGNALDDAAPVILAELARRATKHP